MKLRPWGCSLLLLGCKVFLGCLHLVNSQAPNPSFLQMRASSSEMVKNVPLFAVTVDSGWRTKGLSEGVTMVMDQDARTLRVKSGLAPLEGLVWSKFSDTLNENGWISLSVEQSISERSSNDVKMYSSGFLEGLLTAPRMSQFYTNFYQTMIQNEEAARTMNRIRKMFQDTLEHVRKNSNLHAGTMSIEPADPYWKHARYIFLQLWGVKDGYNAVALEKGVRMLDLVDIMVINANAELPELMEIYSTKAVASRTDFQRLNHVDRYASLMQESVAPEFHNKGTETRGQVPHIHTRRQHLRPQPPGELEKPVRKLALRHSKSDVSNRQTTQQQRHTGKENVTLRKLADEDWERRMRKHGHCSALVRLAPDNNDLLVGHTTWNDYNKMIRIFKYYHFPLPGSWAAARVIGFSSYPGCVSSTDDFYLMDSGLAVMDTSLEILNPQIYDRVPEFPGNPHVPNFLHVMVVNRMAKSGGHWVSLFAEQNSGTNNAQWVITDYNVFQAKAPLPPSVLWVLEQVPGLIQYSDMSSALKNRGYWASFNRPYYPDIRRITGHQAAEQMYGNLYSFDNSPRGTIFNRLSGAIGDMFDMRTVMNRNTYPNEGVFPNLPGHAVSARMDLDGASGGIPNGGIDAKVANKCLFRGLQCQAISGPTHQKQPIFKWSSGGADQFPGWPHMGLPDVWDFDWVQMTPHKLLSTIGDPASCK